MTDPDPEELRDRLAELESTLVDLRRELDDQRRDAPRIPRGLPGGGRPAPRPPRLREVLRFTEEYTIPTLISILEANVRLLQLGGAALRALDPDRSAVPGDEDRDGAVSRALDAGRGLSADRLANSLDDLNDALAGTEATNPEARELLSEAESLSAEIQNRLREASEGTDARREEDADGNEADDGAASPEPDVDAELDSIREEVRGADDEDEQDGGNESDDDGTAPE